VQIVIKDRKPSAPLHLQIIPKLPPVPRDVLALTEDHAPLVRRMESVARAQLQEAGYTANESFVGFHVPPFISVPHLHMHVISPAAQIISRKRLKYVPGSCWFWTSTRVLEKLESSSWLCRCLPW
jgi:diadenosine tetraphosphate (Ap4A) HIT family hydrolase